MTVRLPAALLFVCALLTLGAAEPGQTLADPPLISLELSHSPTPVSLGQDLTLTDKVNAGAHALSNVVLTDTLPHEFTFVRGDAPGGACTVDTSGFFPIVTCPLATIAAGSSVTVDVIVHPDVMGGYVNNAKAKGFDSALNATIFSDEYQDLLTVDPPPSQPSLTISDVSKNEGDSGTTTFDFTVSLASAASSSITVDYATADGTATAPGDYQAASGTLTFAAGQTTKTVTVLVHGDTAVEPNETFTVDLSNAVGATIADGTGAATIVNDDSASPPPAACLTVSPSGTIDFGTGMLSKLGAAVSLPGDQDVTVTNCGTAAETVSVHGTDAKASGTTWNLTGGDPCAAGPNAFGLSLDNGASELRVGSSDTVVATLDAGQSLTRKPEIIMACTGSDGAGQTLTTQLVFTAAL